MSNSTGTGAAANVPQLFGEIERLGAQGEDDKVIKVCERVLKTSPQDIDAYHVKIVGSIKLENYDQALKLIEAAPDPLPEELIYERAYCLYRLNRLSESLDLIRKACTRLGEGDGDDRMDAVDRETYHQLKHLEAQVAYRSEDYPASLKLYPALFEDIDEVTLKALMMSRSKDNGAYLPVSACPNVEKDDAYYNELMANNTAVIAAALSNGHSVGQKLNAEEVGETYEMAYNLACALIAEDRLEEAEKTLELARKRCRDLLHEEEYAEEEIERELAIIVVQLGYVYQLQGRVAEAFDLYQGVLKSKVGDAAIAAVASNNLIAIKKDHELFDSAKKYRAATASGVEQKLTHLQKKTIAMNGAILSLYMNKFGMSRDQAGKLAQTYPTDDSPLMIQAGILHREKKVSKAVEELQHFVKKSPTSLALRMALAQLYISQSNVAAACDVMRAYFENAQVTDQDKYRPGLISLLVWLYGQVDQVDKAIALLEEATQFWKKSSVGPASNETSILKQLAAFKLKSKRPREAAKDYEKLVKADPLDVESVAGLVMAYAEFDPAQAEKYQAYLPDVTPFGQDGPLDVDSLENAFSGPKNYMRKVDGASGEQASVETTQKAKKKRKRKILLPKNYDPNVPPDPERWLPKRERSTFAKKGKQRKDMLKGPQGVAIAGGGIGGTGSANIGGVPKSPKVPKDKPTSPTTTQPAGSEVTAKPTPSPAAGGSSNKKKKKGKK
ncbi:Signal recognition particle core component [Quaeritorhiza haematococci]|nr:Signal recognition particle core component [Quaeritorhiza haematococci]